MEIEFSSKKNSLWRRSNVWTTNSGDPSPQIRRRFGRPQASNYPSIVVNIYYIFQSFNLYVFIYISSVYASPSIYSYLSSVYSCLSLVYLFIHIYLQPIHDYHVYSRLYIYQSSVYLYLYIYLSAFYSYLSVFSLFASTYLPNYPPMSGCSCHYLSIHWFPSILIYQSKPDIFQLLS